MKKALCIILTMLLCASLFACDSGDMTLKSWNSRINEYGSELWAPINSLGSSFDQQYNVPLDELAVYDYEAFSMVYGARHVIINASSSLYYLQQFNESFPIEYIKRIDDEHICVVYKLENDDGERVLFCMILKREVSYFTTDDGVEKNGDYELWKKTGEFYFVSDEFSSADFENIAIGDSAVSLNEIDASMWFDSNYSVDISKEGYCTFTSYRVLTDGILLIDLTAPRNTDGAVPGISEYVVSNKTFYAYDDETIPDRITITKLSDLLHYDTAMGVLDKDTAE